MRPHDIILETNLASTGKPARLTRQSAGTQLLQTQALLRKAPQEAPETTGDSQVEIVEDDSLGSGNDDPPSRPSHQVAPAGALVVLLAGTAFLSSANSVVFALLEDLQRAHGFTTATLGVISASAFAAALFAQFALAPLADRGYERSLLAVSMALGAASLFWFAIASSTAELVTARALTGLALGMWLPASQAMASRTDHAHAGVIMGKLTAAEMASFAFAPVFGALTSRAWGIGAPFVMLGIALTFATPFVIWKTQSSKIVRRLVADKVHAPDALKLAIRDVSITRPMRNVLITSKKREAGTIRDLLRTRAVVGSLMLGVGIGLPVGAYDAIWAKFMSDLGATTLFTSVALTLYALPFILFSTYGGKLADQHGALKVGVIGLGAQVPVVIAYAVFASPAMAMALGAVEATITALALPAAIAAMAKASPQHLAARAQGMHHGTTTIAAGLGAFFMPVIYEGFGALTSFTVLGAVMALAAVFAYAIRPLTTAEAKRLRSRRQLHRLC